jgi:RNA polymerase sigma-70 factor (ECF subfamily)
MTPSSGGSSLSDDALMAAMQAGDQAAFRSLVERHLDRAYALALRTLGHRSDAEDVTQEAFLKLWSIRERWEPGRAKVSTWLYRVVLNRAIDLRRRTRESGMENVPEPQDPAPDAANRIHFDQVSDRLHTAMTALSPPQRAAIALFYYDDMSIAEIATVMETTGGAVESLLKRARQRLRQSVHLRDSDVRELFPSHGSRP